jgi:predicted ATPase
LSLISSLHILLLNGVVVVEAELLYQRGLPPQATYLFKHALIQDTAYHSVLKSKRQQYHQQIAQVLTEQFPDTQETQPELVAHHYTEAGLAKQAIPYWQRAGQRTIQRSANVEAISHLTKGLELLKTLPDTPERAQQEIALQITLGPALIIIKGFAASEVGRTYTRARELCQQIKENSQLFSVLHGLSSFYSVRAELQTALELGEQIGELAQTVQDPALLLGAHLALGIPLLWRGELLRAREHLEQGIACYDSQQHRSLAFLYGYDPGVSALSWAAHVWWYLGYPDQALTRSVEALTLARQLSHPYSLVFALGHNAWIHLYRREWQVAQEQTEAVIALCTDQGFAFFLAWGTVLRGWALAKQGQLEEGIVQITQGLAAHRATGAENAWPYYYAWLAETYKQNVQAEKASNALCEALAVVQKTEECWYEAELYRLKGELTLQSKVQGPESKVKEAEECFLKAIEVAREQHAKSLELRAATSLARLWQSQGKKAEAHKLLSDVYNWFTEGFDTLDLQEAKALLESLESGV